MKMKSSSWMLAMPLLTVLSACTVVVEEDRPGPGPQQCTREYDPVCGRRDGERRTFANACLADRAGYRIIREGECRRDADNEPRFCTKEYRPVCGQRGGAFRTFGNACEADAAGWRVVDDDPC
jgi:hypothetical protein